MYSKLSFATTLNGTNPINHQWHVYATVILTLIPTYDYNNYWIVTHVSAK